MQLVTTALPKRLRSLIAAVAAAGTVVCLLLLTGAPTPGSSQTAGLGGVEVEAGDEPVLVAALSNNNEDTP